MTAQAQKQTVDADKDLPGLRTQGRCRQLPLNSEGRGGGATGDPATRPLISQAFLAKMLPAAI